MDKFNQDIDYALEILTEYGNANFEFEVKTDYLSGKTGSLLLGIRALGSSVSEFIALINLTSKSLNHNVETLTTASNNLLFGLYVTPTPCMITVSIPLNRLPLKSFN
jgi:hypothetical protein